VRKQTVYVASEVCMQHHVRPARIFIACGDGNFYASGLTYSSYGGGVSRARGTLTQNTCTPACFDGSFVSRPGTIQLSHIAVCQGRFYYDEISWRFLQPSPFPANNTGRQKHLAHGLPTVLAAHLRRSATGGHVEIPSLA
jgi:hypothetical protein